MSGPLHIILLLADQWRWDTLFQPGHVCRTPHLDRFAERAQAFRNAFTCCPLCTPARGSLFTGNWPHQNCLTANIGGGSYYPPGKLHIGFQPYLGRLRDDAGYAVAYCGKWPLGAGTLHERGIHNVRLSDGGDARQGSVRPGFAPPKLDGEWFTPFYGSFTEGEDLDGARTGEFVAQLEDLATGSQPFCAVLSFNGPHFPHHVPKRFADLYADLPADFMPDNYCTPFVEPHKPRMQSAPYWPCQDTRPLTQDDWRKTCQHYWGFCTHLDEQLGKVLALLDALGLWEATAVAFTADHGEMLGAHGNFDKGPYFYEEILRIPMIVWDPRGRVPRAPDGCVNLRDLFPTLISLAGAQGVLTDGERARPYWQTEHDCTFYTYDSYQGREFKLRGIRTERWKYTWSPHDLCELYDLDTDPGERTNRIDDPDCEPVVEQLHQRLVAWMESEDDCLLHARHLLPPGAYVDGRDASEQHDHRVMPPQRGSSEG